MSDDTNWSFVGDEHWEKRSSTTDSEEKQEKKTSLLFVPSRKWMSEALSCNV